MKKAARLLLPALLAFCSSVFAEQDTSYYTLSAGYSGVGWNASFLIDKMIPFGKENGFFFNPGGGVGLVERGIIAANFDLQLGMLLPNNPKLAAIGGVNNKFSIGDPDWDLAPYIGLNYDGFTATLGYSFSNYSTVAFSAGYVFKTFTKEKEVEEAKKDTVQQTAKPESSSSSFRYFRPGIELIYPVYRSKIDFFDNSFPYIAGGAGLFFRIGPEPIYFTTGAYAKTDVLEKQKKEISITWGRAFVEVPLLLSFGSGQIRFTGGALLEFYVSSEIKIDISEKRVLKTNDDSEIEKYLEKDISGSNMYWVLGLDIDIVRHWGIGVKFLIWNSTLDEPENYIQALEPSHYQTRVSTYFVF